MNAFLRHHMAPTSLKSAAGACRAAAILTAHALLIALGMNWYTQAPTPWASACLAIMVDMVPTLSVLQLTLMDLAPGPVMQQADARRRWKLREAGNGAAGTARADPATGEARVGAVERVPELTPASPEPAIIVGAQTGAGEAEA